MSSSDINGGKLSRVAAMFVVHLFSLVILAGFSEAYFANWGAVGRQEPTCVDIPANISLCSNIQYKRMRLPNLLAHDTLNEVAHQSSSWVPLLNVGCHPDTQLFLCSLFTPVCLESPIYPCRSLCIAVQTSCEKRMTTYGYNWPDMLSCDNFPEDNDMCVMALHSADDIERSQTAIITPGGSADSTCDVCEPVSTYENILDNFCRADFVLKVRVKRVRKQRLMTKKVKIFKPRLDPLTDPLVAYYTEEQRLIRDQRRALRKPILMLINEASCCSDTLASVSGRYVVMGKNTSEGMVPTFIMPWTRQQGMREAARLFGAGLDCSDPSLFTPDQQSGAILNTSNATRGRGGGRRRGGRRREREGRRGGQRGKRRGRGGRKVEEGERRREGRNNEGKKEGDPNTKKGMKRRNKKKQRKNSKKHRQIEKGNEDVVE